ncbi:hypothetical protein [Nocardioides sp. TF02-7]|uniref:hypothetical protein n=1 Tax=Nocardioides sp. TF02-7 TaxID=2917724 RepID=UPI001F05A7F6|nr:hypothetical protein [Nocardioides sp. TF02-7]UMG93369.1 hypothetical protein MF408_03635 [Nocardioides sp. TF02-7]
MVVRSMGRGVVALAAVLVLACTLLSPGTALPGPASAVDGAREHVERGGTNPWHSKTFTYRKNWVMRSTKLRKCAFIEVSGKLVTKWRYTYDIPSGDPDPNTKTWRVKVRNPSIHVTGWPILGAGCDSTSRWRVKATMRQGWFQSSCGISVDIGVGYPWSVQATPHYNCGTNRVGHTVSTEGPSRQTLHQYNSGTPVHFEEEIAPSRTGMYFTGRIIVRVHTGRASDNFTGKVNVRVK